MRKFIFLTAFLLPVLFMYPQNGKDQSAQKTSGKEIPASKLPKQVTAYISANLPNARITKATKQKRNPSATYVVAVDIKTRHHTLVFDKSGVLVRLDGKKLKATVLKK